MYVADIEANLFLAATIFIQLIAAAARRYAADAAATADLFLFHSFAFILGKSVEGSVGQVLLQVITPHYPIIG